MGKPTGFLEIESQKQQAEPVSERIKHFKEFIKPLEVDEMQEVRSLIFPVTLTFSIPSLMR